MTELSSEVDHFTAAARWVADLVSTIPDTAWPTAGLGDWDLRSLVGHTSRAMLTVEQYSQCPAKTEDLAAPEDYYLATAPDQGADPQAVRQRGIDAGIALGERPSQAFAEIAARVTSLAATLDDRLITSIAGGIRLRNYLPTCTLELVVHGLDVARAIGVEAQPPGEPLARTLELASAVAVRRGEGVDLLLALTGRGILPPRFSVV